ncbi:cycloalkanone monooxygenase [Exophiala viscosa]|uniref:Cycloalkanone monooxygenase n=1 Tax=Exophiala viscosa TaxID=2486360 RepID=A0AAN6E4P6_9EURO|nr:cycloalkanone monooxygenase [Exophiala viscosa]
MMDKEIEIDALVVGAGMGGIYATYRLSQIGLDVKCIDIAGDVGGTWYWNTYPGAMSDTESYLYRYSWDKDDLQTYPWSNHYLYQPEILQYLCHIVDKHGLRRFMVFNVEMTSAQWDQDLRRWKVALSTGQSILARYLVNSLGVLSKPNYPDLPGLGSFAGRIVHTARWDDTITLEGRKVGVIGNGSTGIQVMTAVAPIVSELKSFQRHPQYSVPSGQGPVTSAYREEINSNYDSIWQNVRSSAVGFGVPEVSRKTMEATLQERRKAFQEVWDQGNGFRFMFSAFGDLTTDEVANEEACEFIRGKIDDTVKDPRKAAILKPRDLYARRPLCDSGYYQIYNRDNVDVIDLEMNPIVRVTEQGVAMSDGTIHQLDVLIFATGFDAIEGNYLRLGITGRHGKTIQEHWQNGPTAYGGIACSGFPNMFLVSGPQAPFANFPPVIESEIDFIMSGIDNAERKRADLKSPHATVEVTQEAELEWSALCERLVEGSLFKKTNSWIFGANVAGREATTNFYFGGLGGYRKWVDAVMADGLRGLKFLTS